MTELITCVPHMYICMHVHTHVPSTVHVDLKWSPLPPGPRSPLQQNGSLAGSTPVNFSGIGAPEPLPTSDYQGHHNMSSWCQERTFWSCSLLIEEIITRAFEISFAAAICLFPTFQEYIRSSGHPEIWRLNN